MPEHSAHTNAVRATDENGHVQPDTAAWNDHGCLYSAVVAHPVRVYAALCPLPQYRAHAIDRPRLAGAVARLANERSLLAYISTDIALAGLREIAAKWVEHLGASVAGGALIVVGLFVPVVGLWRFTSQNRRYKAWAQPRGKS